MVSSPYMDQYLKKPSSRFDKAKEYSDDKVQLCIQTYELLARFETEIQNRASSTLRNLNESLQKSVAKTSGTSSGGWPQVKIKTPSVASVVVETDSITDVGAGVKQPSECPIEWFHFPCVKLNTKPKGKWFYPTCMADITFTYIIH
ncbi:inhibitor of growth protein 5-like isoform X2 [Aphis craccivora]|uniref:Inhibitor of growth protein 5-like isoform X2 n=1 Tax=Aphis craccivora TaxID=307492 RepID=A0A6G0VYB8_APHCR|nr:inhibitor of growth protein 5-like isoform X2 [Aphis craccivora]